MQVTDVIMKKICKRTGEVFQQILDNLADSILQISAVYNMMVNRMQRISMTKANNPRGHPGGTKSYN